MVNVKFKLSLQITCKCFRWGRIKQSWTQDFFHTWGASHLLCGLFCSSCFPAGVVFDVFAVFAVFAEWRTPADTRASKRAPDGDCENHHPTLVPATATPQLETGLLVSSASPLGRDKGAWGMTSSLTHTVHTHTQTYTAYTQNPASVLWFLLGVKPCKPDTPDGIVHKSIAFISHVHLGKSSQKMLEREGHFE